MTPTGNSYSPLSLVPLSIKAADRFVAEHHRHHDPTYGRAKFALGAERVAEQAVDAVLALPVMDDAMVERAARALSDDYERGYRGHWCDEWQQDGGCECCRRAARAALTAALAAGSREDEQR